jgi:uncharacterized protein DUF3592
MLAVNWLLIGIAFSAVGAVAILVLWLVRGSSPEDDRANWPATEATIQSVGKVIGSGRGSYPLDVGDFSYVVKDEYYSGRAMISRSFSTGDSQPRDLIDKKFQVRYDPRKPEKYEVSQSEVEGYLLDPYDDFLMHDIDDN